MGVVLGVLGVLGQLLEVDSLGWEAKGFLGTKVVRAEDFFVDKVGWQRLKCFRWVHRLGRRMIGQSGASWGYLWWWGWVLHLRRWDQGDSQSFVMRVMCSIQKIPRYF